jgi:hypothetical protein
MASAVSPLVEERTCGEHHHWQWECRVSTTPMMVGGCLVEAT